MDRKSQDPFQGMQDMARQMFEGWQKAVSGSAGRGTPDPMAAWQQNLDWWSRLAGQASGVQGVPDMGDAVQRFSAQAGPWLGMMQELVGRFGDGSASASDIARAWQSMVESSGLNPMAEMMRGLGGPGAQDFSRWLDDAGPLLGWLQQPGLDWTRQPAFGFAREHQERWQRLGRAMREYQAHQQAYDQCMLEALRDGFERFEHKLAERSEPGRQIDSVRGLFDVWVDAAEEAYAEIALSERFREAYGNMVNSLMRVRQGVQGELEVAARAVGLPTRSDMDAGHRRLHALEREVRRLRARLDAAGGSRTASVREQSSPAPSAKAPAAKKGARKAPAKRAGTAAKKTAAKKTAAKSAPRPATKQATTKRAKTKRAAKQAPARKAAVKKAAAKTTTTRARRTTAKEA